VRHPDGIALPDATSKSLLADAAARDQATARRSLLCEVLWREGFVPRAGLMARVEAKLGRGCFGKSAWEDTFYRDMRAVKQAFRAAGYTLTYSRRRDRPGYHLLGRPALHPEVARALRGAISEIDTAQLAIYQRLGPAGRFRQGSAISDIAQRAVAHRLRERRSEPSEPEALPSAGEERAE
jgi:hypothetical protein